MRLDVDTERPGDVRTTVLRIADELAAELHPHRTLPPASLHTHLDRDLGLDSLAMAELLVRLENAFGASLPSSLLSTAETPEDLLRAVVGVGTAKKAPAPVPTYDLSQTATETIPLEAGTLLNVLDWHRESHPDQVHIHLLGEDGPLDALTYADLKRGGEAVAQGLLAADLVPGESVALMLPTGRDYFEAFLGILLAGGVPVPIYPPGRPSQIEEHLRRHAQILTNAKATMLVTVPEARAVARLLRSSVETLRHVTTPTDLARSGGHESMPRVRPEDTALIQYTSGSTGDPKGVVLSHANVLANIRAMGQAAEVTPRDVFVSWLPLYHDMGLIGAWLGSLCLGMPVVIMSPLAFLARPARWLAAIDAYRGTITGAPNFAYELCLRKVTDTELQTLDLSTLRMALNGAEPVLAGTMERFAQRFAVCGLRPDALAPVYGLAEAAVGLAFPPPGRGLLIDAVDAEHLRRDGQAIPALREGFDTLRIVASGQPLPGYEIRVVDHSGRELPDRTEGQIEFRGPSATAGYQRNSKATAALFHNGWLRTGDLGYVAGGDVFITGRSKDLIIRAGRNLHPEDLETAVGQLPGVRKGCVAAFATEDAETATERLIVVAETTETAESVREELRAQIAATTVDLLGTPPDEVVLAPKGTVLKTSSGKVRRAACADLYEKGAIGVHPRSVWWQVVRFSWRGVRPGFRRRRRTLSVFAYAAYVWLLFVAIGLPTLARGNRAGTWPASPCGPIRHPRPPQALGNAAAHSRCHPRADRHNLRRRSESCQLARFPRHGCMVAPQRYVRRRGGHGPPTCRRVLAAADRQRVRRAVRPRPRRRGHSPSGPFGRDQLAGVLPRRWPGPSAGSAPVPPRGVRRSCGGEPPDHSGGHPWYAVDAASRAQVASPRLGDCCHRRPGSSGRVRLVGRHAA
jgi:acyl-CoA synthetase (AMP-forming)/AMP-acid ligase II/acyl carrier protein